MYCIVHTYVAYTYTIHICIYDSYHVRGEKGPCKAMYICTNDYTYLSN